MLLAEFGVGVASHVIRVGAAELGRDAAWDEIVTANAKEEILLNCVDPAAEATMKARGR